MTAPHDQDDRTVIRPGPGPGHGKPAAAASAEDSLALPIGTRLGEFELTHRIGEGGFSIVYLAWDHTLERRVALKEYMPSSIATRVGPTQISPRSERHRETFEAGLKSFINEAKLLARFDHPAMVKVFRFWEAHGTAYMIMPFYEGVTMRDTVRAMPHPPGEDWLLELLGPLTEALGVIHAEQCYHRDIAPDNIMLLAADGKPLLLDFGAARRVIGDMTQALTVILKPGYAPVEQYAEVPGMKQGAWTDVYALAAVVYWTITGKTPPPSVGRMLSDSWVPLAQCAAGRYDASFLDAVDRALAVRPEDRTQTIDAFRADIGLPPMVLPGPSNAATRVDPNTPAQTARASTVATAARAARTSNRVTQTTAPAARTVAPGETAVEALEDRTLVQPPPSVAAQTRAPSPQRPSTAKAPRSGVLIGLSVAAAIALAGGAWWALQKKPGDAPASALPTLAAPAAIPTPSTAPAPASAPATLVVPAPVPAAAEATAPPPAAPIETRAGETANSPAAAAPVVDRKPPRTTAAAKPQRPDPPKGNSAECARLIQQMSLGDSSAVLNDRFKSLGCR